VTQGPLGTGTVTLNGGGLAAAGGNRTLHNAIVIEQNADLQDGGATTATRNLELAGPVTLSGDHAERRDADIGCQGGWWNNI